MSSVICLHEEGSSSISFIIDVTYLSGCTMAHMVSHWPVTMECWLQSQAMWNFW